MAGAAEISFISSTIANGFVHVPEQADWLPQYLHEMGVFPNGKYEDQVDSISQALDWAKNGMCHGGLFEYYRQEAEKLGYRSAPEKGTVQLPGWTRAFGPR
jgi:hypothetical protein